MSSNQLKRTQLQGKFFHRDGAPFLFKGLRLSENDSVDLGEIKKRGFNSLLVPLSSQIEMLVDAAADLSLAVIVELQAERILEGRGSSVLKKVEKLSPSPAIAAFVLAAGVTGGMMNRRGRNRVESSLRLAASRIRRVHPGVPIGYAYRSANENLRLPFLDFIGADFTGLSPAKLGSALAKMQRLTADRPLLLTSVSPQEISESLRITSWAGSAGAFLRLPTTAPDNDKILRQSLSHYPFSPFEQWPSISVVVCTYNGEETIEECLRGLNRLDYDPFEVIVVEDASRDRTAELVRPLAEKWGYRFLPLKKNGGLSAARNVGWQAARGEIIAYIDQDAFPHPYWLRYLALTFLRSKHAAVGGPNLNPLHANEVARAVDLSLGNPQIVMLDDETADHIPGCNLAVRRAFLSAIGGFDEFYRTAGDDVDFCWRVRENGGTLGYAAGAMVWHHRRNTIGGYLRQQTSYGRGESVLAERWPRRFNPLGHQTIQGHIHGKAEAFRRTPRIYRASGPRSFSLTLLPMMPEWYLLLFILTLLSLTAIFIPTLRLSWGLLLASVGLTFHFVYRGTRHAYAVTRSARLAARVAGLLLLQPLARLRGRLQGGLTPWRPLFKRSLPLPFTGVPQSFPVEGAPITLNLVSPK